MRRDDGYSHRSLARLAYSIAARELADSARGTVPTSADRHARSGELVENAARLVTRAQDALERAVVYERERGVSWADIGHALGISRQAAHERFSRRVEEWREALDEPLVVSDVGNATSRLPDGAGDPERWAARLDEWVTRHAEPTEPEPGNRAVSAGLERVRLVEQISEVVRQAAQITDETDPAKVRRFMARKAAVLASIAAAVPGDPDAAAAAATARRHLAELDDQRDDPKRYGQTFGGEGKANE